MLLDAIMQINRHCILRRGFQVMLNLRLTSNKHVLLEEKNPAIFNIKIIFTRLINMFILYSSSPIFALWHHFDYVDGVCVDSDSFKMTN